MAFAPRAFTASRLSNPETTKLTNGPRWMSSDTGTGNAPPAEVDERTDEEKERIKAERKARKYVQSGNEWNE